MTEPDTAGDGTDDEPVACTITERTREQRDEYLREMLAPYVEVVEARDPRGWRLQVRSDEDAVEGMTTFVRREHECCSFADLELHVSPGSGPNVLEIYGPEGTDELFAEGLVEPLVEEFDVELVT